MVMAINLSGVNPSSLYTREAATKLGVTLEEMKHWTPAEVQRSYQAQELQQQFDEGIRNTGEEGRRLMDILRAEPGRYNQQELAEASRKVMTIAERLSQQSSAVQSTGNDAAALFDIHMNVSGSYNVFEMGAASRKFAELQSRAAEQGGTKGMLDFYNTLRPDQLSREEYGLVGVTDRLKAALILDEKLAARVKAGAFKYGDQNPKDAEAAMILQLYKSIGIDGGLDAATARANSERAVQAVFSHARNGFSAGPMDRVTLSPAAQAFLAKNA